jgi:hypothetical protein
MKTIHMIVDHRDLIHSYGMSHFTLGKHTQIRFAPEKFGIVNIREDEDELSTGLKYDISEGMTREQLMKITQLCNEICDRAYRNPLWFSIGFREFLHLYLQHYGFEYVKQFSYATASHNAELI